MRPAALVETNRDACRFQLRGQVQGLGVRPAIARLAKECQLRGQVQNTSQGVAGEIEGSRPAIDQFLLRLRSSLPARAQLDGFVIDWIEPPGHDRFRVVPSQQFACNEAIVPADLAICASCLAELRTPGNRRHEYPFTHCAACGPRYSLIHAMPYDRARTTMGAFPLCDACDHEYSDASDRRFHAQTICCSDCGPKIWAATAEGRTVSGSQQALAAIAQNVRDGGIAAIKGVGGYQLLVDATNGAAIRRLRARKRRKSKPLAVMMRDADEAQRFVHLDSKELDWLVSPENPIVVLRRREDFDLPIELAPGVRSLGVLLPTSALHDILLRQIGRPVVCTSGNREGEPLVTDEKESEARLSGIADIWLHHDREVLRPVDDSVLRIIAGRPCLLRLGRGFAPSVFPGPRTSTDAEPILATGGEMKSALALWTGSQAVLGPHVGELSDARTCDRWEREWQLLCSLYGVTPSVVAHDAHPDYFATRATEQTLQRRVAVQHHHAHAAAVLWEHKRFEDSALAIIWDGAGYGVDQTIWGGECLIASLDRADRVAFLRPFSLPGGDVAVREPWRIACSLAMQANVPITEIDSFWSTIDSERLEAVYRLALKPNLAPTTSSIGRLFDGVAALALRRSHADYEGEFAMLLEAAYDPEASGAYALNWEQIGEPIDWRPLFRQLVHDLRRGEPVGAISARFHRALASLVVQMADRFSELALITCGGVFQNQVLSALIADDLTHSETCWLRAERAPPGDGGLALGQLAVAWRRTKLTLGK
jgi:hydrogenase maturation protein HypF